MSPPALTSRPFSTDAGGALPRLNGWWTRWELGVGAAGHEDQSRGQGRAVLVGFESGYLKLPNLSVGWLRDASPGDLGKTCR